MPLDLRTGAPESRSIPADLHHHTWSTKCFRCRFCSLKQTDLQTLHTALSFAVCSPCKHQDARHRWLDRLWNRMLTWRSGPCCYWLEHSYVVPMLAKEESRCEAKCWHESQTFAMIGLSMANQSIAVGSDRWTAQTAKASFSWERQLQVPIYCWEQIVWDNTVLTPPAKAGSPISACKGADKARKAWRGQFWHKARAKACTSPWPFWLIQSWKLLLMACTQLALNQRLWTRGQPQIERVWATTDVEPKGLTRACDSGKYSIGDKISGMASTNLTWSQVYDVHWLLNMPSQTAQAWWPVRRDVALMDACQSEHCCCVHQRATVILSSSRHAPKKVGGHIHICCDLVMEHSGTYPWYGDTVHLSPSESRLLDQPVAQKLQLPNAVCWSNALCWKQTCAGCLKRRSEWRYPQVQISPACRLLKAIHLKDSFYGSETSRRFS